MNEQTWLWVGVWGMAIGAAALLALGPRASRDGQFHTSLHSFVPAVAATLYLLMALGQGAIHVDGGRELLYARYVDWSITTPLLLLALASTAVGELRSRVGLMVGLVGADVMMILTGFASAVAPAGSSTKWVWYIVSCGAFLAVYYAIWGPLAKEAKARSAAAASAFTQHAAILSVLWFLYPIVFYLGPDGGGSITPALATLLFLVLDLTTKVAYAFITYATVKKVVQSSPSQPLRTAPAV